MKNPKRTRIVAVRMTEAEYQAIQGRAKRRNRSVSSLMREACYTFDGPITHTMPSVTVAYSGSGGGVLSTSTWTLT